MIAPARIPSKCAACLKTGSLLVTQEIVGDTLVWVETFDCGCGHAFEAKGEGFPSPYARKGLLHANGHHRVQLLKRAKGPAFQELLAYCVGSKQAKALAKPTAKLPATVYEGTVVEAEFFAAAFSDVGAQVKREAFDPPIL
jgi:hypothetical protein